MFLGSTILDVNNPFRTFFYKYAIINIKIQFKIFPNMPEK